ncbi:hypothetical protein WDV85_13920 [Pseudokineococcus sp. 5B2Z-1]|uniref:DoxX family protein n=1 Tax=Pseudokineococcus sp. 5B2Z-1 TaxID=3132744 RepID=UPI0030B5CFDD
MAGRRGRGGPGDRLLRQERDHGRDHRGDGRRRRTGADAAARWMSASFTATGLLHLVRPAVFDAAVPRALGAPRPWTLLSGAAELVCAAALAAPDTRRAGGVLSAALLLAVWPANISMAQRALRSPRASRTRRVVTVVRVPLQVPMVVSALAVARCPR